jgi:hypothetical protein
VNRVNKLTRFTNINSVRGTTRVLATRRGVVVGGRAVGGGVVGGGPVGRPGRAFFSTGVAPFIVLPAAAGVSAVTYPGGGAAVAGDSADAADDTDVPAPTWSVKYVRVVNRTGDPLTVYARTSPGDPARSWTYAPGEEGLLAVNKRPLACAAVSLWAEAGEQKWTKYRDEACQLVPEPYEADDIDTYTFTFPEGSDEGSDD